MTSTKSPVRFVVMLKKPGGLIEPPKFTHFVPSQCRIAKFAPCLPDGIVKLTVIMPPVSAGLTSASTAETKVNLLSNAPGSLSLVTRLSEPLVPVMAPIGQGRRA